jgi:hypothetical protein
MRNCLNQIYQRTCYEAPEHKALTSIQFYIVVNRPAVSGHRAVLAETSLRLRFNLAATATTAAGASSSGSR